MHLHGGDHVSESGQNGGVGRPPLLRLWRRRRVRCQHLREQQRAGGDQLRAGREQGRDEGSWGACLQMPDAARWSPRGDAAAEGDEKNRGHAAGVGSCYCCCDVPHLFCTGT
uniref:Uncharacterized protein n=1 Tax=Arundo donax TaxID=35708 RepID=A0A0A8YUP3_ARUDO